MARRQRAARGLSLVRTLNLLAFAPLASRAPTYGRLLLALLRDDRVPSSQKAILGAAAAYLVLPVDLIPEGIPVLGAIDDVAVVVLALDLFIDGVPRDLLDEHIATLGIDADELDRDLAQVRRFVPGPIRSAVQRLPGAFAGAGRLVSQSGLDRRLRTWITEERPA